MTLLYGFLHRNRLAALVAEKTVDHVEFGEFVSELAMRTRDAQHVARAIRLGLSCLRFLVNLPLKVWTIDRLTAVLAEISHYIRLDRVICSAMSAMHESLIPLSQFQRGCRRRVVSEMCVEEKS